MVSVAKLIKMSYDNQAKAKIGGTQREIWLTMIGKECKKELKRREESEWEKYDALSISMSNQSSEFSFPFDLLIFLSSSYQNWEFLTEFWNSNGLSKIEAILLYRTYSIWSLTIRLTHFQHAGIFGIKKQLRQVLFSMYFFRYVLGHIITLVLLCLVSERTYACTHPSYVYVCACLFIFLFALLLLFSCCGDPMPLFSNTGEKLYFLAAADSVS